MSENQPIEVNDSPSTQATGCWWRFIYNNNPFYVISVCLVLYGIHVSFGGGADLAEGWLLLKLLGGYTVLLLLSAILIVRVGAVWEDARTIVLLILVLLVALSASFDKVCMDSVAEGRSIQLFGFCFSIAMIEFMLRGVKAKLPLRYQGPLYALFALLFYYPTWLGELSINGEEPRMAWYVFLFPAFAGLGLLTLLPAARNAGRGEWPNGTPWRWPLYPWCGLAFLAVALTVRSYGLSVSFELADGFETAFHFYYLVPLLLAVIWILAELAVAAKTEEIASLLCIMASAILLLALPGRNLGAVQGDFLATLQDQVGAPLQWTSLLIAMFYGYFAYRGIKIAEYGVYLCVLLFVCSRPSTVSLDSLQPPMLVPGIVLGLVMVLRSRPAKSSWRFLTGCMLVVVTALANSQTTIPSRTAWFFGALLLSWMIAGIVFDDELAKFIQATIQWIAWLGAILLIVWSLSVGVKQTAIEVPLALFGITTVLFFYWMSERTAGRLAHVLISLAFSAAHGFVLFYAVVVEQLLQIGGRDWLMVGLLSLGMGILVSLSKAGVIGTAKGLVGSLNQSLTAWLPAGE